jgi:hypothetical protein
MNLADHLRPLKLFGALRRGSIGWMRGDMIQELGSS